MNVSVSEEWTIFETVAFARSDHHHGLLDNFRLTWTFELDQHGGRLCRAAAFVPPADAAVLHRDWLNALALAVLDATRWALAPQTPAFPASTTATGLNTHIHTP